MALKNRSGDMTPFDMSRRPRRQSLLLMPFIWAGSFVMTRKLHLRIEKHNMDGVRPPYLVLSTHQGFSDYYIAPLALFPHRAVYVSDMEGFAAFGNELYRALGCIGKRRYVPDINVMLNIKKAVSMKQTVVIFPESRHSDIGTTSPVPDNMGRLAKSLGLPLVILSINGSYLANPFWDEERTRKVPIRARLECICTGEELKSTTAEKLQEEIEKRLSYDEYDYQHENGIMIRDSYRAEGLEKALYQCIGCKSRYTMNSSGYMISCSGCGRQWELSEDGWLVGNDEKIHPPHWYEWQREQAVSLLEAGSADREYSVIIQALPNEKGFVPLGEGRLRLDSEKFTLEYTDHDGSPVKISFPHRTRESVQTELNYRGRGACIVLSTRDCCYYIYSDDRDFSPTELRFIGEWLYSRSKRGVLK